MIFIRLQCWHVLSRPVCNKAFKWFETGWCVSGVSYAIETDAMITLIFAENNVDDPKAFELEYIIT